MVLDKVRQKIAEKIAPAPDRVKTSWDRLHKEAGFIPLQNENMTEIRRQEVKAILNECYEALFKPKLQREVVQKVYRLFFTAGDQWFRGLDNRELARKVSDFLRQYTELGYMEEFIPDLFEEAMQLLSLSWQALDVDTAPMYIIESRPVVFPPKGGMPHDEIDETGLIEMQKELEEARKAKK